MVSPKISPKASPKTSPKKSPKASPKATKAKAAKKEKATKPKGEKKPLKGFMLFSQQQREAVKKENPGLSFGEVGKALGARWSALSDAEKAKYK